MSALDDNGVQYLLALYQWKQRYDQNADLASSMTYRDAAFAYYSESQDILLQQCNELFDSKVKWRHAKCMKILYWLKNSEQLVIL